MFDHKIAQMYIQLNKEASLEVAEVAKGWLLGEDKKDQKDLVHKINSRITRDGWFKSLYEVMVDLSEGDFYATSLFKKDAVRRGITEKVTEEILSKKEGAFFEKLPNNHMIIFNNEIVVYDKELHKNSQTKTLDHYAQLGDKHFFITQKYTTGTGGAQTATLQEMERFIEITKNGITFGGGPAIPVVLVDGSFYTQPIIENLLEKAEGKVLVCGVDDFWAKAAVFGD